MAFSAERGAEDDEEDETILGSVKRVTPKVLKKLVKELRRSHAAGDAEALERLRRFHPKFARSTDDELRSAALAQRTAQMVIARERGFDNWQ